jgi:hypothetical protein
MHGTNIKLFSEITKLLHGAKRYYSTEPSHFTDPQNSLSCSQNPSLIHILRQMDPIQVLKTHLFAAHFVIGHCGSNEAFCAQMKSIIVF